MQKEAVLRPFRTITGRKRRASCMPRPYPDSAKRENFCGGWDFQKAHPIAALRESVIGKGPEIRWRRVTTTINSQAE